MSGPVPIQPDDQLGTTLLAQKEAGESGGEATAEAIITSDRGAPGAGTSFAVGQGYEPGQNSHEMADVSTGREDEVSAQRFGVAGAGAEHFRDGQRQPVEDPNKRPGEGAPLEPPEDDYEQDYDAPVDPELIDDPVVQNSDAGRAM